MINNLKMGKFEDLKINPITPQQNSTASQQHNKTTNHCKSQNTHNLISRKIITFALV